MAGPSRTAEKGARLLREDGQALVELALVLPLLALLLWGVLEFGLLLDTYLAVTHAAREGARVGVLEGVGDAQILQRIRDSAPQLKPERLEVSIQPPEGERRSGDPLTVQVRYRYTVLVPGLAPWVGPELWLTGRFTMRVE